MSDFLSNFSNDDYKDKKKNKKSHSSSIEPTEKKETIAKDTKKKKKKKSGKERHDKKDKSVHVAEPLLDELNEKKEPQKKPDDSSDDLDYSDIQADDDLDNLYEVEIDKDYQKKQRNKKMGLILGAIVTIVVLFIVYYNISHVKMPNFTDKSITDVKKWANENKMTVETENEYSLKIETSHVIKQETAAGKKVKKGSDLKFVVSQGADPEELIKLPDFSDMNENQVKEFIDKNKADNISIINDYSDKVEKGKFIKTEFGSKEVTADTYRRRDILNVYFSKGKETFEKNISVPDFADKTKTEVEEWAKKNSITVTYEDVDSDKIEVGKVVSQSVAKNEKLAKNDSMTVSISTGKAIVVPNYANYSAETSATAVEGLTPNVKQVFSDTVPYGQLISQSIEAGTKLTGSDNKTIDVVYSYGQPYIKSYYGQLNGDIPKLIYDDFNSKGANITYDVYEMDSDQPKGTIVKMSLYNQYIPSDAYITFGISNGRFAGQPTATPQTSDSGGTEEASATKANNIEKTADEANMS